MAGNIKSDRQKEIAESVMKRKMKAKEVVSPEGEIVIEHTLVNRKERRRREKLYHAKYVKRNKPYVKGGIDK